MDVRWQCGVSFISNLCCNFYRKILGNDWQPKSPLEIFLDHEYFQMMKYNICIVVNQKGGENS